MKRMKSANPTRRFNSQHQHQQKQHKQSQNHSRRPASTLEQQSTTAANQSSIRKREFQNLNGNRTSHDGSAERLEGERDQIFSSIRDGKQVSMMERPHSSGMYGSVKSSFTSTYPVKITAAPFSIPTRPGAKASDTKLYKGPEINLNKT